MAASQNPLFREILLGSLNEQMYPDNAWLNSIPDVSSQVGDATEVELVATGTTFRTNKGAPNVPATPTSAAEYLERFLLHRYQVNPVFWDARILRQLPYDRKGIQQMHMIKSLAKRVATEHLYEMLAPQTTISALNVTTTRTLPAENYVPTSGATFTDFDGVTRKKVTHEDFDAIRERMQGEDIPTDGWVILPCIKHSGQMRAAARSKQEAYDDQLYRTGAMPGLFNGFGVLGYRSLMPTVTHAALNDTPELIELEWSNDAPFGSISDTGASCSIIWHPDYVARAMAETLTFRDEGNPLYFGDIESIDVWGGAFRAFNKGVYVLYSRANA